MRVLYLPSLLLLSFTFVTKSNDPFTEMLQEMHDFEERMHQKMEHFFTSFNNSVQIGNRIPDTDNKIEFKDDTNNLNVTLTLGCDKVKDSDIAIEAKENNLEGSISYGDKKLNFFVKDGRIFGTSLQYEAVKDSDDKDSKKGHQRFYSTYQHMQTLPSQVTNLENAKIMCEKNQVKLVLPKFNKKSGWRKLEVNHKK